MSLEIAALACYMALAAGRPMRLESTGRTTAGMGLYIDSEDDIEPFSRSGGSDSNTYQIGASATEFDSLLGEIIAYSQVGNDWDGYAGLPASEQSIQDALAFLEAASYLCGEFKLPTPMLSNSGRVGLYWANAELYTDIEFDGNGRYSLLVKDRRGNAENVWAEDLSVDEIPEPMITFLASVPQVFA